MSRGDQHPTRSEAPSWTTQFGGVTNETIGPYRLLGVIGEGGFGIVYLAEQRVPIARRVALKVIRPGMDSKAVVARFEQERQALAVMDHPNVARVFDAGTTDRGQPYFVMEHVPGEPITEYCDRHRLTTRQRLELFVPVCEAVQHAHTKGIIHRDLKPSNVLVVPGDATNPEPTPKVIDFGVAKAISRSLTEKTIFTEQGQIIGTPEYMSPEQAEMNPTGVDTRSDVYSLGVMLYELLTGVLPFDSATLRAAGYAEIQRIIREVDPPRPSTRLTTIGEAGATIAERRQTDPGSMSRELRRELEWIPLKAMRKDRNERYGTPADLGRDIDNYLQKRPLEAGPESAVYRLRKGVSRHRRALVVTALLLCVIGLLGTALTLKARADQLAAERVLAVQRQEEFRTLTRLSLIDELGPSEAAIAKRLSRSLAERVLSHRGNADDLELALRLSCELDLVGRKLQRVDSPDLMVQARPGRFSLPGLKARVTVHAWIDDEETTPAAGWRIFVRPGPENRMARTGFSIAEKGWREGVRRLRIVATAQLFRASESDPIVAGARDDAPQPSVPIDPREVVVWENRSEIAACRHWPDDYPLAIPNAEAVAALEAGLTATLSFASMSLPSPPRRGLRLEIPLLDQPFVFEVRMRPGILPDDESRPVVIVSTTRHGVSYVFDRAMCGETFKTGRGDAVGLFIALADPTDSAFEHLEAIEFAGSREAARHSSTSEAFCPFNITRRVKADQPDPKTPPGTPSGSR